MFAHHPIKLILGVGNANVLEMKSTTKPRIPSGFYELLPGDQIEFNNMVEKIRSVYELFGFVPIETPAVEFTEVLLAKGGGDTEKQIYRLSKEGDDLSLHFDLTVPLARYVAEHVRELSFPFRRYQIQKVWRGERNQKGRFREFYQCDIDVIGSENIFTDAEMLAVTYYVFKKLKVDDFTIRINNRKIFNSFLLYLGLQEKNSEILRIIDKLEKQGGDEVTQRLLKIGVENSQVISILNFVKIEGTAQEVLSELRSVGVTNDLFKEGMFEMEGLVDAIQEFAIPEAYWKIDLSVARGLDYYTGSVYETTLNNFPELGSICSGGRYDNLAGYYTNEKLSGVGVSIGLTRLFSKLKELNYFQGSRGTVSDVLVVVMDEKIKSSCLDVAMKLRNNGIKTEVYLNSSKLDKQLKYANRLRIPFVVLMGEDEARSGKLSLKNMMTGQQKTLSLNEAMGAIKNEQYARE